MTLAFGQPPDEEVLTSQYVDHKGQDRRINLKWSVSSFAPGRSTSSWMAGRASWWTSAATRRPVPVPGAMTPEMVRIGRCDRGFWSRPAPSSGRAWPCSCGRRSNKSPSGSPSGCTAPKSPSSLSSFERVAHELPASIWCSRVRSPGRIAWQASGNYS